MDANEDYYANLGVLPSADVAVIRAAYLALVKKYHPDTYDGDSSEASRITKRLNAAWSILSDPAKRAEYDDAREEATGDFDRYSSHSGSNGGSEANLEPELLQLWDFAVKYYPDLLRLHRKLVRISPALALSFQASLALTKDWDRAEDYYLALTDQFLTRYFGSHELVRKTAMDALIAGRKDFAIELNKAVARLGSPRTQVDARRFIETADHLSPSGQKRAKRREQEDARARAERYQADKARDQETEQRSADIAQKLKIDKQKAQALQRRFEAQRNPPTAILKSAIYLLFIFGASIIAIRAIANSW